MKPCDAFKKNILKPWQNKGWLIPPEQNGSFVAHMEMMLDICMRPYYPRYPVVRMDKSPNQLIAETQVAIPSCPGNPARYDYECRRCGVYNAFLACEHLAGKCMVNVAEHKSKHDCAYSLENIALHYKEAEKMMLGIDNLNTHTPGALYETFPAERAKALWNRFEFVYTAKHESWPNMAEIELNVLKKQCLNRRTPEIDIVRTEVSAW